MKIIILWAVHADQERVVSFRVVITMGLAKPEDAIR
jgi:hypothetical protein